MSLTLILIMASLAVPLVAIVLLVVHLMEKRREFLNARIRAAAQFGWQWVPPSPWLAGVAAGVFEPGRPDAMVAGGFRGRQVCCLDYSYETTSTDSEGRTVTSTQQCHLVALNLPSALPPLTLTGESWLVRLFAGQDLKLGIPAFDDKFRIQCLDARYASAVLHPQMMELMFACPWVSWHIAGNALVSWGHEWWSPQEAVSRLEVLIRIADLIPPYILRDYGQPSQVTF